MRWLRISCLASVALIALFAQSIAPQDEAHAQVGGPVVLMGIDAEDCGPGGHGPISVYQSVATSILNNVSDTKTGGILVIGGDANCIQPFWNALAAAPVSETVTYVSGAANISTQSFAGFEMIGIASDFLNTFGGMTNDENAALTIRANDLADFVNAGGGLLGFSSCALAAPYGYLGTLAPVTCAGVFESDITPTAEGSAVGITDALDVCCWHDAYSTFPAFLDVLATYPNVGGNPPAALGCPQCIIRGTIELTPQTATNPVRTNHTVTATAQDGDPLAPAVGVTVTFTITSGPNVGQSSDPGECTVNINCTTDANGQVSWTYTDTAGVEECDIIQASFVDQGGNTQNSNPVEKCWEIPPVTTVLIDIKPGSFPNSIKLSNKGVIPVAILTTPDFDATTVDPATVCFGDAEAPAERDCTEAHSTGHIEDVDGDGDLDLVLHYETGQTGIDPGDTQACLTGTTFGGTAIEGCDSVRPLE